VPAAFLRLPSVGSFSRCFLFGSPGAFRAVSCLALPRFRGGSAGRKMFAAEEAASGRSVVSVRRGESLDSWQPPIFIRFPPANVSVFYPKTIRINFLILFDFN